MKPIVCQTAALNKYCDMSKCKCCQVQIPDDRKFCSNKCQAAETSRSTLELWLNKKLVGHKGKVMNIKDFVRKYLLEKAGHKCCKCGWDKPHPISGTPPLEINHIDGDATNTWEDNLEVLCPNCHALTPNFKNRNKASKRKRK